MATLHRIINQSGTRLWAPQSEPTMPNPELGFKSVESRPARELDVDVDVVGGDRNLGEFECRPLPHLIEKPADVHTQH